MPQPVELNIDEQFRADLIAAIPHLRRYAWSLARRHSGIEADDLVQMAAERGLAKASSYRPTAPVKVWLLTILHNIYVDKVRQSQRDARTVVAVAASHGTPTPTASGDNPMDKAALRDVAGAVACLPLEQREVIMLVGLEGLQYAEVADVLGIPVGTVRSRLSRGREALRTALEAQSRRQAN